VSDSIPQKPALYFDGGCPVCAREIALYRRQVGADSIDWIDVSRCAQSELGNDLTKQAALTQLHYRTTEGELISGAAAFARIWQALPRWAWLGRAFGSGIGLWLLEGAYRIFLRMRPAWRR
jgi:predicted DCC family thiol-disulfide oxidoreductase YuxK